MLLKVGINSILAKYVYMLICRKLWLFLDGFCVNWESKLTAQQYAEQHSGVALNVLSLLPARSTNKHLPFGQFVLRVERLESFS